MQGVKFKLDFYLVYKIIEPLRKVRNINAAKKIKEPFMKVAL